MTVVKMINTFKSYLYWFLVESYSVHYLKQDLRYCTKLYMLKKRFCLYRFFVDFFLTLLPCFALII